MVEIKNLCAGYGRTTVLHDISFALDDGTVAGLLGANGCGKTTLIKAICGMLPHEGSCLLDGKTPEKRSAKAMARLISYIPQRSGISIDMTAREVVLMGFNPRMGLLQQPTKQMKARAEDLLLQMRIDPWQNYQTLSEGQKQLCILARTMVTEGKLLLLDEPESALDLKNRYEIFEMLCRRMKDRTVLAALHDPQLALQVCDTLVLLKDKTVLAVLHPQKDTIEQMEQALCEIYGTVRLYRLDGQLVMVKQGGRG